MLFSASVQYPPNNQQYVGRIPDLKFYHPDGMMSKKKEELNH